MQVWDGECHVHAGIRPADINALREREPGADFLVHPECGCTTQVMEYVAAGDVDATRHPLPLDRGHDAPRAHSSENDHDRRDGDRHPASACEQQNPDKRFIAANEAAVCRYMKMITLPKLRDSLRDVEFEVTVAREVAEAARVPIERMVAIG